MIIALTGPTSSGKTKLSIMLAKKYKAIIINADSCQVYKEMNIGTAKIKDSEKEEVEHFLFDIKEPDEDYSVSDYQSDARKLIEIYKNRNIIFVGGTGLYLNALFYDYRFLEVDKKEYDSYSNEELYSMCKEKDSNLEIHPNNRIRLINFLKRTNTVNLEPILLYDVIFIGLTMDREVLYKRINAKVDDMIKEGLVEEVETLYKKYGKTKALNRIIGYKEIISYLDGLCSLEESIDKIKKNTRHYAKRQYTWFNNKMNIKWFTTDLDNFNNTYNEVVEYIEKY